MRNRFAPPGPDAILDAGERMDLRMNYSLAFYAEVARRAAAEAEGVVGTARDPFLGLIGRISRGYNRGGVRVYQEGEGIFLEVDIVAAYGHDLRRVLRNAQHLIARRIEEMSGEPPARVTVAVKGVADRE